MADIIVTDALRDHLLSLGLIERPPPKPWPADYQAQQPVFVLNPRFGLAQPDLTLNSNGQPKQLQTVSFVLQPGPPPLPFESSIEERIVDVYLRSHKFTQDELWHKQVRNAIQDQRWVMFGNLRVLWCMLQRYPQPINADERTYDSVQSFRIAATQEALAAG